MRIGITIVVALLLALGVYAISSDAWGQDQPFTVVQHRALVGPLDRIISGSQTDGYGSQDHARWPGGAVLVLACREDGAGQMILMMPPRDDGSLYGVWYEPIRGLCSVVGEGS